MRAIAVAVSAALLITPALPARAADKSDIEKRYSVIYTDCMDKALATVDFVDCARAELTWQDKYLTRRYQALMAELTAKQKARLRTAQRAWIAYRDAWCAAQESPTWGTLSTVEANVCIVEMTIDRTIELENYPPGT